MQLEHLLFDFNYARSRLDMEMARCLDPYRLSTLMDMYTDLCQGYKFKATQMIKEMEEINHVK